MKKLSMLTLITFLCVILVGSFQVSADYSFTVNQPVEILNYNFESGFDGNNELPGWHIYTSGTPTTIPAAGTVYENYQTTDLYNVSILNGLSMDNSNAISVYDAGTKGSAFVVTDPIQVVEGEVLTYAFDAKKLWQLAGTSYTVGFVGLILSANEEFNVADVGVTNGSPYNLRYTAIGGSFSSWAHSSKAVTVPSGINYARVALFSDTRGMGHFYADNITLTRAGSKTISQPKFTDSTNAVITALPEAGDINVSLTIKSTVGTAIPVIMISGLYDENNILLSLTTQNNYDNQRSSKTITSTLTMPAQQNHKTCKVIVFGIQNGRIVNYMPMISLSR